VFAQSTIADWSVRVSSRYAVRPNVTYLKASGYESKLDFYRRRDVQTPLPTAIYYHSGGWVTGNKEAEVMELLPWFEMGWNVVNVEYRIAGTAQAPAAVEDAICALRYVVTNAKSNNIDTAKIVLTGVSAGGHLALAAGMMPSTAGLANICPGGGYASNDTTVPQVAAIVSWLGPTDVADLVAGQNIRSYAVQWTGSGKDQNEIAKLVSPVTYVRPGLPPIFSIHGDVDPIVPYSQVTRLHDALTKGGVPHELYTITGKGHGNFTADERVKAYGRIRAFLAQHGLGPVAH
jgi:acetyl esterase/lipase